MDDLEEKIDAFVETCETIRDDSIFEYEEETCPSF